MWNKTVLTLGAVAAITIPLSSQSECISEGFKCTLAKAQGEGFGGYPTTVNYSGIAMSSNATLSSFDRYVEIVPLEGQTPSEIMTFINLSNLPLLKNR